MYLKSCCTLLLLALVACQAAPSPKIIETETNKELTIEETGEERDRAKKAATTFCVQINSDGKEEAVSCDSQKGISLQPAPHTPIHIVHVPQVPHLVMPSQPAPLPVPLPLPAPVPAPVPAPLPAPLPTPATTSAPKPAPLPTPVTTPAPKPAPLPTPVTTPAPKPAPQPIPLLPPRLVEFPSPAPQAPSASHPVINILPSAPCTSLKPQFGKEKYALVPPTLGKLSSLPRKLPVLYRVATQPELMDTSVYPFYPLDESTIEITKTTPLETSDMECGCARLNQAGLEGGAYHVSPIAHFNPNIVRREIPSPIVAAEPKHNHKHHHHHRHKKTEINEDTSAEEPHESEEFRNHTSSKYPTQIVFLQFPLTNQPTTYPNQLATYPLAYPTDFSQYATDFSTYPIFSYPNTYQATTYIRPVYHNQNLDELVGQSNPSTEEESEKANAFETDDLSTNEQYMNPIIKEELRE